MRLRVLLVVVPLLLANGLALAEWRVHERTLDNGMQVLVREDARAPVAVSQLWYRVGSSDERRGITGISHFLEHMMFKGTETLEPGEFSRLVAREGGRQNAFTGPDFTGYYEQLAADRLELAFRLEADRMANLVIDPELTERERAVVLEERRRNTDDDPVSAFFERYRAVAEPASPYAWPIIGWEEDIRAIGVDDLRAWYERWYMPANAVLVVVGQVDPESVFDLAERHFGPIHSPPAPERPRPRGLQAPGERRLISADARVRVPHLTIGYDVPSAATAEDPDEVFALLLAASILDGGEGARLSERLVRERGLAASARAGFNPIRRYDSRFGLDAVPNDGVSLDTLEEALREEVRALAREPVSDAELSRARNQMLADFMFQLDSVFYQAMRMGMLETADIGWSWLSEYEQRVRAVTPEDIQRVAARYFTPQQVSVGRLLPDGDSDREET